MTDPIDHILAIVPDIELVTKTAIQFFSQDAIFGQKIQNLKGEGTEFDALAEFLPGMDKRAIDWKHSARHANLLAREYRTERNHNIIFAIDSGTKHLRSILLPFPAHLNLENFRTKPVKLPILMKKQITLTGCLFWHKSSNDVAS